MVCSDHIDSAVCGAGAERLHVATRPQRRVHLEAPVLLHVFIAESKVMRTRFACNLHPSFFCTTDQVYAFSRGYMTDVQAATGLFGEPDVSLYFAPFTLGANAAMTMSASVFAIVDISFAEQGIDFAVRGKYLACLGNPLHGIAHGLFVLHAGAII